MVSTRLALLELAGKQQLSSSAYDELRRIATTGNTLSLSAGTVRRSIRILALGLAGLGLIFFIAANWEAQDPLAMFVVLEGFVAAGCYGAVRFTRLRIGFVLFALLSIGALLGFFGQHYQSGADPWQLFALWSALSLPLAFASRSDLTWTAWVIIAMCAISTWLGSYSRTVWDPRAPFAISAAATSMALAIPLALSKPWRTHTGAGAWSQNLALLSAAGLATSAGVMGLFGSGIACFWFSLIAMCAVCAFFAKPFAFDTLSLSIAALAVDVLLVCGSVRPGLETRSLAFILIVVGVTALGALALSAMSILHLHRNQHREGKERDEQN